MGKAQVSFPVGEGWNVSPPGDDEVIMHLLVAVGACRRQLSRQQRGLSRDLF